MTSSLKWIRRLLYFLMLLGAPSVAHSASAFNDQLRLSQFSAMQGPVRLTDVASSLDLFVPVSPLFRMTDATVELQFTHSIALQSGRSYLLVRLNDISLGQVPYDPTQPVASARVRLPAELWKDGFNKLTIAVVQHYVDRCEDSNAPELWTELNLHESRLAVDLIESDRPLTLRDISGVYSPGLGGLDHALLLTSPDSIASPVVADVLPVVAQALALRRRYAPLRIEHAQWSRASQTVVSGASYLPESFVGRAHVLVGTYDELRGIVSPGVLDGVTGPHLAIDRVQGVTEPGQQEAASVVRVIVTGATVDEVRQAAVVLSDMEDALNPVQAFSVLDRKLEPSVSSPYDARVLHQDRSYTFEAMGFQTTTLRGFGGHGAQLKIMMPPDFYTDDSAEAELLLDLAYGAGMGPGSVINFHLNGKFIHGRLLDAPNGLSYRGYRIVLPARALTPGPNVLDMELTLRPETVIGECAGIDGRHLFAQIMASSRLVLPPFGAVSTQPNLELFRATAFPYVSTERDAPKALVIATPAALGSALTIVGKLAQIAESAQENWRVHVGMEGSGLSSRALVVATTNQLPADLFASWSIELGRTVRWPYRVLNDLRETGDDGSQPTLFQALLDLTRFGERSETTNPQQQLLTGSVAQTAGLGPLGAMSAFRNPRSNEPATITVVTAADQSLLDARVSELISPEVWSRLEGDLVTWDGIDNPVTAVRVADSFEIGTRDPWLTVRMILSNRPWYWLAWVIGAVVLFVISARFLVGRRRKKLETGE